ncbi:unnamed protein product [Sphagnum tenellum]
MVQTKHGAWLTVGLLYLFMLGWSTSLNNHSLGLMNSEGLNWLKLVGLTGLTGLMVLTLSALIAVASSLTWEDSIIPGIPSKITRLARAGLFGLAVQFLLGTLLKLTRGGLACPNFPLCVESFLPIPSTFESHLAFFHRWWGVLLLGHFYHLAYRTAKSAPILAGPTRRAFALSVAQVFLGIGDSFRRPQSRFASSPYGSGICTLGDSLLYCHPIRGAKLTELRS